MRVRGAGLLAVLAIGMAAPARGQPKLGPDRSVDAPVPAPAFLDQQLSSIAYGGGQYLAVWRDGDKSLGSSATWTIRAVRLSTAGVILDDPALTLFSGLQVEAPSVAFDGARFLVVWHGISALAQGATDIFGAYVSANGQVEALTVFAGPRGQQKPMVAGGGGRSLVTYVDATAAGGSQIHGTLLNGSGASIGAPDFVVNKGFKTENSETISTAAWGGSGADTFLVAWEQVDGENFTFLRGVRAATVLPSPAAYVIGDPKIVCEDFNDCFEGSVTSTGSNFFALWSDLRVAPPRLYGRLLGLDGTPVAADFEVAGSTTESYIRAQLAAAGNRLFCAWEAIDGLSGLSAVRGTLFDTTAPTPEPTPSPWVGIALSDLPLSPPNLLPSGAEDSRRAAIATDGSKLLTVWTQQSLGVTGDDVLLTVHDSGSPLSTQKPRAISLGRNYQNGVTIAGNGQLFLLVWEDDRNADQSGVDLFGLRVGLDGAPIDAAPFIISNARGDQFLPSVAARGSEFLVAWADERNADRNSSTGSVDLYACRVPASGAPLAAFPISQATNAQLSPSVAAGPDGWLVAWETWERPPDNNRPAPEVRAKVVAANETLSTEIVVAVAPNAQSIACAPAAVWNGRRFFVAYEQPCSLLSELYGGQPADLFGRWIAADGSLLAGVVTVANLAGSETGPRVAADDRDHIYVTWRDETLGNRIRAGVLDDSAAALRSAASELASGAGAREAPSVSWSRGTLLFTWVETSPPGIRALRTTEAFAPLESAFELVSGAPFRVTMPLSSIPSLRGLNLSFRRRATPPPVIVSASDGRTLVAFNFLETVGGTSLSRAHDRGFGALPQGVACTAAGGCASGICTGGVCCDTPCDGICQACSARGCIETPASDVRCPAPGGVLSCAALSTQCRTYADVPLARCAGFGQCAEPGTLAECTQFADATDGTACEAADCPGSALCVSGGCVCASGFDLSFPERGLPPPSGCSVGGRGGGGAWMVIALLFAIALRRRAALLLALLAGCEGPGTALSLTLRLDDPVFIATARVRIVLTPADATPVRPSARHTVAPGIEVANFDVDGDGALDVVIDLVEEYPLTKLNRFEVVPPSLRAAAALNVRCEVIDRLGNTFARLGGPARAPSANRVAAVLQPSRVSAAVELRPACIAACPDPTLRLETADTTVALAMAPDAMALGNLTGVAHVDLIVSSAHVAQGALPNAGQVAGFLGGGATFSEQPNFVIQKMEAGAQLGTALASGDLDGDGKDELVIGAPGAGNTRGAVYVLFGRETWPATIDLDGATELAVVSGIDTGDRLGAALAIGVVDATGTMGLVIGAPGRDAVFVAKGLARGERADAGALDLISGADGSQFGRAVAVEAGSIAVGAPLENGTGAVHWFARSLKLSSVAGQGGAFGSAIAFVAGSSGTELVVGAPVHGAVFVLPAEATDLSSAKSLRREGAAELGFGAALARLRRPGGDALVVGAPAGTETRGDALVVRGATVEIAKQLQLDAEGHPAAALFLGERAGDALGRLIAIGDLDGDGSDDLAAASSRGVHILRGPIL